MRGGESSSLCQAPKFAAAPVCSNSLGENHTIPRGAIPKGAELYYQKNVWQDSLRCSSGKIDLKEFGQIINRLNAKKETTFAYSCKEEGHPDAICEVSVEKGKNLYFKFHIINKNRAISVAQCEPGESLSDWVCKPISPAESSKPKCIPNPMLAGDRAAEYHQSQCGERWRYWKESCEKVAWYHWMGVVGCDSLVGRGLCKHTCRPNISGRINLDGYCWSLFSLTSSILLDGLLHGTVPSLCIWDDGKPMEGDWVI